MTLKECDPCFHSDDKNAYLNRVWCQNGDRRGKLFSSQFNVGSHELNIADSYKYISLHTDEHVHFIC